MRYREEKVVDIGKYGIIKKEEQMDEYKIKAKIISALEKVLPDVEPTEEEFSGIMLQNERHHFQLAFFWDEPWRMFKTTIEVGGPLAEYVTVRSVENVPATYTPYQTDDFYISTKSGVYPDVLKPIGKLGCVLPMGKWKAFWVSVYAPNGLPQGVSDLTFSLYTDPALYQKPREKLAELTYRLEVVGKNAVQNELRLTNWMHYDCICAKHNVKPFGEKFYKIFSEYLKAYTEIGLNMLFTPLFTPPLDTEMGGERRTAQLVEVKIENGAYRFDFSKLDKFIRFARAHGIRYFEFSHLFTQHGGRFCPKIVAKTAEKEEKIFAWETRSDDPRYTSFLEELLPQLCAFIEKRRLTDCVYFHLTDEPEVKEAFESYAAASRLVKKYVGKIPVMDAMGETEFYEKGLVDVPVAVTSSYTRFENIPREKLFVYYALNPTAEYYSNRFITMPSLRMRILGVQLYETGVGGFLHWGFNFYNSARSIEEIDPYGETDAGGLLPAGDGFIVYPAGDKVYKSIRAELTGEAIRDYNELKTLETLTDKTFVAEILREFGIRGYTEYPRDVKTFQRFRRRIVEEIAKR